MPGGAAKTYIEADRSKIDAPIRDWGHRLLLPVIDRQHAEASS
jgi:hypothetical protein